MNRPERSAQHLPQTATDEAGDESIPALSALSVACVYLLLVLLILVGTWMLITQDWVRQQKVQETELSSLSRSLQEKLTHDIRSAEQALRALGATLQDARKATLPTEQLLETARKELQTSPQLARLTVLSAQGTEIINRQRRNLPEIPIKPTLSTKTTGRTYQPRLHIQAAIRASDGKLYLPLERELLDPRHQTHAYLIALLSLDELDKYFQGIRLTSHDFATLLSTEGRVLATLPANETNSRPDFQQLLGSGGSRLEGASFGISYDIEGRSHLGVFRWLPQNPLIIETSRPSDIARAGFTDMKRRLLFGDAALLSLLGVLAWLVYHESSRHRFARAALGRINASLEARVSRRTAELEQSNREMIAFSYSISHDLRAPLRAINGFAHALKEDFGPQLNEQGKDYLERICRASVRMGELIDELLSLANVSRAPLTVRELELSPIASEIIEDLRLANPERQVVFQAQSNLKTEGDEALLRNALTNLIGNAWKFTRARRPAVISLSAEEDGEFMRFTLADNGIGFDMAHAKRLFQPFQQLHAEQGFGGTGIGLASVRRILERHGGQIWAEASPEQGARFIFTLPRRAQVIRRRKRH